MRMDKTLNRHKILAMFYVTTVTDLVSAFFIFVFGVMAFYTHCVKHYNYMSFILILSVFVGIIESYLNE